MECVAFALLQAVLGGQCGVPWQSGPRTTWLTCTGNSILVLDSMDSHGMCPFAVYESLQLSHCSSLVVNPNALASANLRSRPDLYSAAGDAGGRVQRADACP